ncbi:hypothetical protein VTL71DRAFT_13829 [Oculimacula yallundae]|uniref:Uncharacterized protein n=1 Tax=Oculimacula yallundae TaxID=86028 RepID=A0ABR4CLG9_9HELO
MSDSRHRSSSGYQSRSSKSHECCKCHELSRRGGSKRHDRRGLGRSSGERLGWERQDAVRFDDSSSRLRVEMDDSPERVMDGFRRRGDNPIDRQDDIGAFGRLGGKGAIEGGSGPRAFVEPGRRNIATNSRQIMSGSSPRYTQYPTTINEQSFQELPTRRLRQQPSPPRPEYGMEIPRQDRFMRARSSLIDPPSHDLGIRSPSLSSSGSFDMRAMDRPRMPYGPFQGSPMQVYSRYSNYRSPYVEDYQNSDMEAEMAQQAPMHHQQQVMYEPSGNPFYFQEGQYSSGYP